MKNNNLIKRINNKVKDFIIEFNSTRDPAQENNLALILFVIKKFLDLKIIKHIKSIDYVNNKIIIKLKTKKPPK